MGDNGIAKKPAIVIGSTGMLDGKTIPYKKELTFDKCMTSAGLSLARVMPVSFPERRRGAVAY